jgi:hypothetical protein
MMKQASTSGGSFRFLRIFRHQSSRYQQQVLLPTVTASDHTLLPQRQFATKSKKKDEKDDESSASYFDRKAALKQQRVEAYQHKLHRAVQLKHRRNDAPKDVLKNEFRSWWEKRQTYEEILDRKARQAGMPWKIQVSTIVERLPVVLPDKLDFEKDFEELQAFIKSNSGKEYPTEFTGNVGADRPVAVTDEELIGTVFY